MSTNNSNDNRAWLQIVLALISLVSAVSVAWVAANRVGVETGQQQAFATAALQRETTIADAPTKNSVTQIAVTQIVVTQVAVTQVAVTQVAVTQIVDNNIPTIIASLNTPTIAQSSESTMVPPYPACLLIGDWEAQLPNNKSQLRVQWNNVDKIFEGKVIVHG